MNVVTVLLIAFHAFAIYDAISNLNKVKNGGFRLIFAFFPPLLGPIIYFLTRRNSPQRTRNFIDGKRRFS